MKNEHTTALKASNNVTSQHFRRQESFNELFLGRRQFPLSRTYTCMNINNHCFVTNSEKNYEAIFRICYILVYVPENQNRALLLRKISTSFIKAVMLKWQIKVKH